MKPDTDIFQRFATHVAERYDECARRHEGNTRSKAFKDDAVYLFACIADDAENLLKTVKETENVSGRL